MTKRSTTIIVASIATLAVVSIFSVGFAKWALVETDQTSVDDGQIIVATIDTSQVNKFVTTPTVDHPICFGIPTQAQIESYGLSDPWLTVSGSKYEVLSTFISMQVTGLDSTNYQSIIDIGELTANSENYATAYSEGLVGALPVPTVSNLEYDHDNYARLRLNFSWGSAFNNENPYKYYNSQTRSPALETEASTKLSRLKSLLDGITYTIKLGTKSV